jgi:hypothetical protein
MQSAVLQDAIRVALVAICVIGAVAFGIIIYGMARDMRRKHEIGQPPQGASSDPQMRHASVLKAIRRKVH